MISRAKQASVVNCGGHDIPYEVVRRRRVTRNVYLELNEEGGLRIIAPARMSERAVHRALQAKSDYVLDFIDRAREKRDAIPVYGYTEGEQHLYLGYPYPLVLLPSQRAVTAGAFDGRRIPLVVRGKDPKTVLETLRRWYREQAQGHFQERLEHFSAQAEWTGGRVPPLRLRRMKRTTGSCSRSGLITMNPHLVKAPPFLIDYVIAHEVCHLREHNHGPGFYRLLSGLYPQWKAARAQLRRDWMIYRAE